MGARDAIDEEVGMGWAAAVETATVRLFEQGGRQGVETCVLVVPRAAKEAIDADLPVIDWKDDWQGRAGVTYDTAVGRAYICCAPLSDPGVYRDAVVGWRQNVDTRWVVPTVVVEV